MSVRRALTRRLGAIAACVLGSSVSMPSPAAAQDVHVEAPAAVDREILRDRIAQALAPVPRAKGGALTVTIDAARQIIQVVFVPERGAPLERTVPAPLDPEERMRTATWLAVNVASDEASDLVATLRPPVPPPAPLIAPPPTPVPTPAAGVAEEPVRPCSGAFGRSPFSASFFSPLGYPFAPTQTHAALAILYGDLASVRGAGLGTVQRVRCNVEGAAVGFLGNVIEGDVRGAAIGGAFDWIGGTSEGAFIAGGASIHRGPVEGLVAAPLALTFDRTSGVKAAVTNVSLGPTSGAEIGVVNVASALRGVQVGVVNVTSGKVSGAQLGVINVAEDADAAVGLLSVSWARRLRVVAWTSSITPIEVGVMLEGKRVYSGLSFGRLLQDIVRNGEFLLGFEIGVHLVRNDDRGLIWDVLAGADTSVGIGDGNGVDRVRTGTRVGYRVFPRFAPYLYGGSALVAPTTDPPRNASLEDLVVHGEFGGGAIF